MTEHQPVHYELFCLVFGEDTPFSVTIQPNMTVGDLKDVIKLEKQPELDHLAAYRLMLYLVTIPDDDYLATNVRQQFNSNPAPKPLKATSRLSTLFPVTPAEKTVHILVQVPKTAISKRGRSTLDSMDLNPRPTPMQQEASALHFKAWGKQWPQSEGTISKTEISGDESGLVDDDDDGLADMLHVPTEFKYRYFKEIQGLKRALGASRGQDFKDFLVVRKEYEILREALESLKHCRAIVVTGHPGIGKTTFLYYLLLHRLENKLPTAIQLGAQYYIIFDEQGAIVHPLHHHDPRLANCWALTDSNEDVRQPCAPFKSRAELVILASAPEPERWKGWIKQAEGLYIISDLPSVPEIAAIVKELKKRQTELQKQSWYEPSSTLSLVHKWGPSTRNIIRSMECAALGRNDPIEEEAQTAAILICQNPLATFGRSLDLGPQGEGSSVIFLRRTPNASVMSVGGKRFIPTPHLLALFEEQRCKMANRESLQLFYVLSSHAFTRPATSWAHEKSVHERLALGGADLSIFQGSTEKHMRPSTHLLPGTLNGLKAAGVNKSFYWIPSVANFPGVDGVLGDTDGHVYTIQTTIATSHRSSIEGIKKVWENFDPEARAKRTWHFVFIMDKKQTADAYMEIPEELRKLTLGKAPALVEVSVWACVLQP